MDDLAKSEEKISVLNEKLKESKNTRENDENRLAKAEKDLLE